MNKFHQKAKVSLRPVHRGWATSRTGTGWTFDGL